jgi:hypothetical protein
VLTGWKRDERALRILRGEGMESVSGAGSIRSAKGGVRTEASYPPPSTDMKAASACFGYAPPGARVYRLYI